LGTVLKISPVVAVPLLALRRQWRRLAAYVAGVIGFTGVSIWRLGWQTNLTWVTGIYPAISSGLGNIANRSFAGLVDALCGPKYFANFMNATEWPVPPGLALIEKACSLAIGLGFIFWCWRKRKDAKGLVVELVLLPLVGFRVDSAAGSACHKALLPRRTRRVRLTGFNPFAILGD
jgi:hypothetical protein